MGPYCKYCDNRCFVPTDNGLKATCKANVRKVTRQRVYDVCAEYFYWLTEDENSHLFEKLFARIKEEVGDKCEDLIPVIDKLERKLREEE